MKKLVLTEELSRIKKLMIEQENNYDSDESGSVEFSHERDGKTYPFLVDDDIVDTIPASLDLLDRVIDNSDMDEREKRNLLVLISYLLHNALNEVSHEISTDEAIKIWDQISKN
jgi:hypothetical protein